jgi:hypothetical protein
MKFCPVVPEICRGQVHGARKERRITRTRRRRIIIIIIIIIRRNGAKTKSLQTLFGRLKYVYRKTFNWGVTIESYGKLEISYINVDNF